MSEIKNRKQHNIEKPNSSKTKKYKIITKKEQTTEIDIETSDVCMHITEKKIKESVVDIHEAEEWLRDNEYILRGYRNNFDSFSKTFKSLFMIHNESINVWTHLLGAFLVIFLIIYTALFIESKKDTIYAAFDNKWDQFNEEFKNIYDKIPSLEHFSEDMQHKLQETKDRFNEYTNELKSKTVNYIHNLENRLQNFTDVSSYYCPECIKKIIHKMQNLKENFDKKVQEIKRKFIEETKHLFEKEDHYDIRMYSEDLNEKIRNYYEELLVKMDSKEMEWIDIYKKHEVKVNAIGVRRWPLFVFLTGAIICLTGSALFHWFFVHSEVTSVFLARLDYAGISFLIAGSCYPPYYYFFYCNIGNVY